MRDDVVRVVEAVLVEFRLLTEDDIGELVGIVMRRLSGRGSPLVVQEELLRRLSRPGGRV